MHRLNALRTDYLRNALARRFGRDPCGERPLQGVRVLDIGCGGGILSESMARLGCAVHGIDVVERNIAVALRHGRDQGLDIRYQAIDVESLATQGGKYDAVLNMEVVEHVADLPGFMAACSRLVRPGGLMAAATINRTPASFLAAIVGAEYLLRWLPRGTHQWRRFVTPAELESLLNDNGMALSARTGVRVNPLTKRFDLTPSLAVNYMLIAAKPAANGRTTAN